MKTNRSNRNKYTLEWCPFCEVEVMIFANSATKCPECGATLLPCSACDVNRDQCRSECPYKLEEGVENTLNAPRK